MIVSSLHGVKGFSPTGPASERLKAAALALVPDKLVKVEHGDPEVKSPEIEAKGNRLDMEKMEELAKTANDHYARTDTQLHFEVGERTGRIIVKVIDEVTQEVVRTIPPEEFAQISDRLTEMRGLLFTAKG